MTSACILIRVKPVFAQKILTKVKAVRGVVEAFRVFGRYDLVVFAEGRSSEEVARVSVEINGLEGVRATQTIMEIEVP